MLIINHTLVCQRIDVNKLLVLFLLILTTKSLSSPTAAAELPILNNPSTISGEPSTAAFYAGATADNGNTYNSIFTTTELVDINARILVAPEHVGDAGDLYVVNPGMGT